MQNDAIYVHTAIIKNETGGPLNDTRFIDPIRIKIDDETGILYARQTNQKSMSRVSVSVVDTRFLEMRGLVLPIDGALEIEFATDRATTIHFEGVHNSFELKQRDYHSLIRLPVFSFLLGACLVSGFMIGDLIALYLVDDWRSKTHEFWLDMGVPKLVGAILTLAIPFALGCLFSYARSLLRPMCLEETNFMNKKSSMTHRQL